MDENEIEPLLDKLMSSLTPEDLHDPAIEASLSQILEFLKDSNRLDPNIITQVKEIPDKTKRFQAAIQASNATSPEDIKFVAQQLQEEGLLGVGPIKDLEPEDEGPIGDDEESEEVEDIDPAETIRASAHEHEDR